MTNQSAYKDKRRRLRQRFARFLGEPISISPRRKALQGVIPLWGPINDEGRFLLGRDRTYAPREYSTRAIQTAINEVFERLRHRNWGAYVVGGTLRDLM